MKILFIYGENIPKIEARINEIKSSAKLKNWSIEYFDPVKFKSLPELLSSTDLFTKKKIFIADEPDKISKKDFEWLKSNFKTIEGYLLLVKKGNLNVSLAKMLPDVTKKEEYKLPKLIFKFCEAFFPGNQNTALKLLHDLENSLPPEFVMAILGRHMRDLYWIKLAQKPYPYKEEWRVQRLSAQSRKFNEIQLKSVINKLAEDDILSKSSNNNIIDLLDQIVLTLLK